MTSPYSVLGRLPQWALTLIAFLAVIFIFTLGAVAIFSERDVKFWPPEIGPGPKSKLVEEFKRASADLDKNISELLNQRKKLNENLQVARSSMARADAYLSYSESRTWHDSAAKIEAEIKNIDEKLISKIEGAKFEMRRVESKLAQ